MEIGPFLDDLPIEVVISGRYVKEKTRGHNCGTSIKSPSAIKVKRGNKNKQKPKTVNIK